MGYNQRCWGQQRFYPYPIFRMHGEISLWFLPTSWQSLCTASVLNVPMNCVMEIRQMARSAHKIIVPQHNISQTNRWQNIWSSSPHMWCYISNLDLSLWCSVRSHCDCSNWVKTFSMWKSMNVVKRWPWVEISASVQIYDCGVSKIWTYERGVTPRMAPIRSRRQPTTLITRISHPPGFLMPTFWALKRAGFCG